MRQDSRSANAFFSKTFVEFLADVIALLMSVTFLIAINWRVVAMVSAMFPLLIVPGQRIRARLLKSYQLSRTHMSRVAQVMHESLQQDGALLTRTVGGQASNLAKFDDARDKVDRTNVAAGELSGALWAARLGFWTTAYTLTYWLGG